MHHTSPKSADVLTAWSDNLPQLIAETKLMHQYRIAAAVHGGGEIVAIAGSAGLEIFTVATDNMVWNFYPDPASDTGYSSVSTGLMAGPIAAGVDENGNIVVFAGNNIVLNYVVQTGQAGSPRWGSVQQAALPVTGQPLAIAGIYASQIGGALYVGVLTRIQNAILGNSYAFSYTKWGSTPVAFTRTTMILSGLNCLWSGTSDATAEFTSLAHTYIGYEVATGTVTRYPMAASFNSLAVASAFDGAATQHYFAILNDGNAYQLIGGVGSQPYSWAQITQGMTLRDLRAHIDDADAIQLFALSGDNRIYHIAPQNNGWRTPAAIQSAVAAMASGVGDARDIQLFLVGTAQASLTRMIRQGAGGDWQITPIEVPTSGDVEEFISYSTDVTVTDARGAVLSGATVQVWASAQTQLSVNGGTYVVDPTTPVTLAANGAGQISITQQTNALGVPSLQFNVVGAMSAGSGIAVRQYAGTHDRLGAVTSEQLLDATVANGTPLLADQYRNADTTAALASAFQECMKIAGSTAIRLDEAAFHPRARRLGVGPTHRVGAANLNRIQAHDGLQSWQIDFSSGQPVFRFLDADDALALIREKQALHQSVGGIFDVFEDIGDFVVGIANDVVDVIDTVVTVVGDAVNAAITFISDGVSYVFNTVISAVEQAFDVVETIFAKVKVFFEQVFEWLGFLFGWNDILRTHTAIAYALNQYLGFVQGAAGGIQRVFDSGMTTLQAQIDTLFDGMIASIGGSSPGGYVDQNRPDQPGVSAATANNVVLNNTVNNMGSATSIAGLTARERLGTDLDPIITQLQQFAKTVQAMPEWSQAVTYLTNLGSSVDNIFTQLLSALLTIVKGIARALVSGLQAIVDALLQLVASLVAQIQSVMNEEWDIPFVSAFYAWLTDGSKLTTLDLMALIIAVPTTIFYKATKGAAPFPDDTSVNTFKAAFNSQTLLAASGLGPPNRQAVAATAATAPFSGSMAELLAIGSGMSTIAFGFLSAIMDAKPQLPGGLPDPFVEKLTYPALICEIVAQCLSTPWLTSTAAPDCTTPDGALAMCWLCEAGGVVLDGYWVWKQSTMPENSDDWGTIVAFLYALVHIETVAFTWGQLSTATRVSKVALLVPETMKPLRLTVVQTATNKASLPILAALDAAGYLTSGIAGIFSSPPAPGLQTAPILIPGAVRAL